MLPVQGNMDQKLENLWKYIRGDMSTEAFEDFIYNDPDLEELLGEELYFEVIAANFRNKEYVDGINKKIKAFLNQFESYFCQCHRLRNKDMVGMGWEDEFFRTFTAIIKQNETNRWLYIRQCTKCQQRWLIAEEGIYSDDYYLYRLSDEEFAEIEMKNKWPTIFNQYENLLVSGPVFRNTNNLSNHSVMYELAKKNPGIKVEDLAQLLSISINETSEIAKKLIKEKHVFICLPDKKCWIQKIVYQLRK